MFKNSEHVEKLNTGNLAYGLRYWGFWRFARGMPNAL